MEKCDNSIYKYMMLARKVGKKSTFTHQLGCVIVKSGRVLSTGYNQIRHCGVGYRYTSWSESLHAERDACRKISKDKLIGSTIFIYREHKNGDSALSLPCSDCYEMLEDLGFKKIIYSTKGYPFYNIIKLRGD